jgi:hypothetical protein
LRFSESGTPDWEGFRCHPIFILRCLEKTLIMKTPFFAAATICAGILVSCSQPLESNPETEPYETITEEQEPTLSPEEQQLNEKAAHERAAIIEQLKAKAAKDWPNDYSTQEFWINEEIAAYDHMLTVPDDAIKRAAQRDWPLDFTTQKFWYYQQMEAKERLK